MENTSLTRAQRLDQIFGTPVFAVLLAIFCNVLWGCAFPFIKMGYRLFAIDPSNTASIFCFAGVRLWAQTRRPVRAKALNSRQFIRLLPFTFPLRAGDRWFRASC